LLTTEGIEIYQAVDEWYQDAKLRLRNMLKPPFVVWSPEEIQAPLRIMRDAMEAEGMLVALKRACEDLMNADIGEIEMKLRGIRDSIARMVAESLVTGLREHGRTASDYGVIVTANETKNGFTIEVPYDMISMSDLFMVRSKRISGLSNLCSVRDSWCSLIGHAVSDLQRTDQYPMLRAEVHVLIEITHPLPLDPDHFWVRPIIDALVENGILVHDDANHIIFIQEYRTERKQNRALINCERIN